MVIWTSFPPPNEGVKVIQPNTVVNISNKDSGKGTLYIAESRLSWVSDAGQGFSLEYPAITLHAISKDLTAFPHECLYVMIDSKFEDMVVTNDAVQFEDENDDDDKSEECVTEVRFIPDDTSSQTLFQAMSECQALHPDPQGNVSNEEEEEEEEEDGDWEEEDIQPGGGAQGDRNGSEPMDFTQFEDADDNPEN